jgi:2-oxoglutarate ferredoxin oxidoreductase subunit alpha
MSFRESIAIKFEGSAGDGILTMGRLVARAAARSGYHVSTHSSFLAQVRGGQSSFQLRIGRQEVLSPGDRPEVVVALNHEAAIKQGPLVTEHGLVLHPPWSNGSRVALPSRSTGLAFDYEALAAAGGSKRSKNLVPVGILTRMLGIDPSISAQVIRDAFVEKDPAAGAANVRVFEVGLEAATAHEDLFANFRLPATTHPPQILLSGNEAAALGAIVGGVRFFAGYPITPASEVMEYLALHLPRFGGRVVQAEDEIAALGMCIGAAFGGVRAFTATSGPGLSLMAELVGLAAMAELPVVILDVQRAGPSTGIPTKDGQGDLNLAVYGTHGDVPRVVIAPQSVADCFHNMIQAVNVAHEYQIPVVVLSSQSLSHAMQTMELPDLDRIETYDEPVYAGPEEGAFVRFQRTPDGHPSKRSIPGTPGGMYRTGGLEHDESGYPSHEPQDRVEMVERRTARVKALATAFSDSVESDDLLIGRHHIGVLAWGRTAAVAREVVAGMRGKGWEIGHLFPHMLWPLPDRALRKFLTSGLQTLFVCEANSGQQFAQLVRAHYSVELTAHEIEVIGITKDDGNPFLSEEIREQLYDRLSEVIRRRRGLPFSVEEVRRRIFGEAQQTDSEPPDSNGGGPKSAPRSHRPGQADDL